MSTLRLQKMRYKVMLVQMATALLSPPQSPPELSTYVAKEVNTGIRKTRICMNLSVGRTQVQRRVDVRFESMQCHVKLNQVGKLMSCEGRHNHGPVTALSALPAHRIASMT